MAAVTAIDLNFAMLGIPRPPSPAPEILPAIGAPQVSVSAMDANRLSSWVQIQVSHGAYLPMGSKSWPPWCRRLQTLGHCQSDAGSCVWRTRRIFGAGFHNKSWLKSFLDSATKSFLPPSLPPPQRKQNGPPDIRLGSTLAFRESPKAEQAALIRTDLQTR